LVSVLLISGCNPVRQDRTITFSKNGDAVGFQHDAQCVYVAGKGGGPPIKVFQPGPDVAAVSTPLWNPKDQRLIFTTPRPINGQPAATRSLTGLQPEGALFSQRAIRYTCWLRDEPKNGEAAKPVTLFEATCDHVGYVAANLAVRWHPNGGRILYVKQIASA